MRNVPPALFLAMARANKHKKRPKSPNGTPDQTLFRMHAISAKYRAQDAMQPMSSCTSENQIERRECKQNTFCIVENATLEILRESPTAMLIAQTQTQIPSHNNCWYININFNALVRQDTSPVNVYLVTNSDIVTEDADILQSGPFSYS